MVSKMRPFIEGRGKTVFHCDDAIGNEKLKTEVYIKKKQLSPFVSDVNKNRLSRFDLT